ncbi:MAG: ComEC/Rec2 family competence protein [Patescibacteria group bacterium]
MIRPVQFQKYGFLLFYLLLALAVVLRIYTFRPRTLPINTLLKFEATISSEVESRPMSQKIKVLNLRIYAPNYPKYKLGDRLIIEGKVDGEGNVFSPEITKIGERASIKANLNDFRDTILSRVSALLPSREAALVVGALIGVDRIPEDFKVQLIKTGTIHVVVVSGQNLMIVAGVFISLSKYLGRRLSLFFSCLAVLCYAFFTGFEPPVVRALIMVFTTTVALYLGRTSGALFSIFLSGSVILLIWPDALTTPSFLLTFAATLGIVTLGQMLSGFFSKVPVVGENAAVSLSAFIFTAPVILYFFGSISLLAPLVNILVLEAVFPIMLFGFLLFVTSVIFTPVAQIFAFLTYLPAHYFSAVVDFFSKFDVGYIKGFAGNLYLTIFLYVLVFGLMLIWRGERDVSRAK